MGGCPGAMAKMALGASFQALVLALKPSKTNLKMVDLAKVVENPQ